MCISYHRLLKKLFKNNYSVTLKIIIEKTTKDYNYKLQYILLQNNLPGSIDAPAI